MLSLSVGLMGQKKSDVSQIPMYPGLVEMLLLLDSFCIAGCLTWIFPYTTCFPASESAKHPTIAAQEARQCNMLAKKQTQTKQVRIIGESYEETVHHCSAQKPKM